jgi:hypothetical protein
MDMPGFPERARPNSLDPSRRTPAYSPPVPWTHSGADGPTSCNHSCSRRRRADRREAAVTDGSSVYARTVARARSHQSMDDTTTGCERHPLSLQPGAGVGRRVAIRRGASHTAPPTPNRAVTRRGAVGAQRDAWPLAARRESALRRGTPPHGSALDPHQRPLIRSRRDCDPKRQGWS